MPFGNPTLYFHGGMKMGIDVYLHWNRMAKAEKEAQYTGFDITCGKVGYLHASYGMAAECMMLELIFPKDCWKSKKVRFDFKKEWERIPEDRKSVV